MLFLQQRIDRAGSKMNQLATEVADKVQFCFSMTESRHSSVLSVVELLKRQHIYFLFCLQCPHSQSKNDLLAYIQRITLFSHQLTITSRVKADIQTIAGVEVVSAVSLHFIYH